MSAAQNRFKQAKAPGADSVGAPSPSWGSVVHGVTSVGANNV